MKRLGSLLTLLATITGTPSPAAPLQVGQVAPAVSLEGIDGTRLSLADLRGQVVVLNYWATWCAPCRAELPLLDAYYEAQKSHGLRVFAPTTESSLPLYRLRKVFAKLHLTPVKRLKAPYNADNAVSMNYVIDRAGRLRYAKAGAFDVDMLNEVLVPLLKEPPPAS